MSICRDNPCPSHAYNLSVSLSNNTAITGFTAKAVYVNKYIGRFNDTAGREFLFGRYKYRMINEIFKRRVIDRHYLPDSVRYIFEPFNGLPFNFDMFIPHSCWANPGSTFTVKSLVNNHFFK
jgi:hypothetical protein